MVKWGYLKLKEEYPKLQKKYSDLENKYNNKNTELKKVIDKNRKIKNQIKIELDIINNYLKDLEVD